MIEITEVSPQINYWFFRTDGGENFDTYLGNNFIAIGWNYISLYDLRRLSDTEVKARLNSKLKEEYPLLEESTLKRKSTDAYNKMIKFIKLQVGDIIMIPSENSNKLAFGRIADNRVFIEDEGSHNCKFTKRRKIEWLTQGVSMDTLDPIFYKIRTPQHTITKIDKENEYYIDSVLYNLYQKEGRSHFVIKIGTTDPINLGVLAELLSALYNVLEFVNKEFDLNEDIKESSIRLNLQSPGLLNMSAANARNALIYTAILLGATGCSSNNVPVSDRQKIETLQQQKNDSTIFTAREKLRTLRSSY